MSSYTIARLCADNTHYLDLLHETIYKSKVASEYFKLKYNTAYTGKIFIGYFAIINNEPVAFYGVVPVRLSIRAKTVIAAQSCDTMTHPEHRKKGLFIELANHTFELAKQNGIDLVFGFPNQHSYRGFVERLGFTHSMTMNRYTINFSENIFRKIYRAFFVPTLRNDNMSFENSLLAQGFDGVIYDAGYYAYKKYNRNFILQKGSDLAWINKNGYLFVGALSNESADKIEGQIAYIKNTIKPGSITFMVSPGTNLDTALSEYYKAEEGYPVIIKNLSGNFSTEDLKFQFADIDIF